MGHIKVIKPRKIAQHFIDNNFVAGGRVFIDIIMAFFDGTFSTLTMANVY